MSSNLIKLLNYKSKDGRMNMGKISRETMTGMTEEERTKSLSNFKTNNLTRGQLKKLGRKKKIEPEPYDALGNPNIHGVKLNWLRK